MPQAISSKKIVTRAGDTFDSIAYSNYKNEQLSSEIIALNPDYSNVLIFGDGMTITVPVYETNVVPATLPPWRQGDE